MRRAGPTMLAALACLLAGCAVMPYESVGSIDPSFPPPPQRGALADHADDRGDIRLVWPNADAAAALAEEGELPDWVDVLNSDLALPHDIPIRHTECGIANAYYSPDEGVVTMCWELLSFIAQVMQDPQLTQDEYERGVGSVWLFIMMHELGHALVDTYDLPITGREEDAVDDLATLTLIDSGASNAAVEAAIFWILSDDGQYSDAKFADEHSLNAQRFYATLCTVYGSDPEGWSVIVDEGYLTPDRGERCVHEYPRKDAAWDALLGPWRMRT